MEQLISLLVFAGVLLSVLSGLASLACARKLRELMHKQQVLATDMDYRFNEVRQNLNALAQHTAAQLQQFAQSQPRPQPPPVAAEPAVAVAAAQTASARQSVTERRHRVLTLARRGMDVKAIAQTLGMPHGEVGLIIRMSNPKFGD
jgi:DNA-binding NarL/FixJ family response regulator